MVSSVLFVNKWDLMKPNNNNQTVTENKLDNLRIHYGMIRWFSISAKSGLNVRKGMNFMISKICKNTNLIVEQRKHMVIFPKKKQMNTSLVPQCVYL